MSKQNINLNTIRIDGGTQSRVGLNMDAVAEYASALDDSTELPPIVVFNDGSDNWLADGFHRFHAYVARDRASIPADVQVGTQRDAILFACGANATHGLRRTNEDKRKAVAVLLGDPEWSKLTDREIGRRCHVDHKSVATWRNPPPPAPPAPKQPPTPKGAGTKGGEFPGDPTPANPPAPAPRPPAPPPAVEPDTTAEDAHGDTDMLELLTETQTQLEAAQRELEAANADDLKAEAMKWQRLSDIAKRRESELQKLVNEREAELKRLTNTLRRIGKAVGEEDPSKIAATVEEFVRSVKVAV